MADPLVSVIIPAYNGARHIGATIQSVLDQTYQDFELIVVDDQSPDDTAQIVQRYSDPRVHLIVRHENGGSDAARLTGLQASRGEIVAFLDQDDLYHEDKLRLHIDYFERHPNVGLTYNARFLIEGDRGTILRISRPPSPLTFPDLILGYPIAPSDAVMRRQWAKGASAMYGAPTNNSAPKAVSQRRLRRSSGATKEVIVNGGEIVWYGRLWMAGCQFGAIDRALNYRRLHPQRIQSNLDLKCRAELMCQEIVLADPRCPSEAQAYRGQAAANFYLYFGYDALYQEEVDIAAEFIRSAVRLNPNLVAGQPCELISYLATDCSLFDDVDHVAVVHRVFRSLPPELDWVAKQQEWAITRGYLIRATRNAIWERMADANRLFTKAVALGAPVDKFYVEDLISQLRDFELEFGSETLRDCLARLDPYLHRIAGRMFMHKLKSQLAISLAFRQYETGHHAGVPASIGRALLHDPRYLTNRGVLSILARSQMHNLGFMRGL